jgi:hypothetical protein
MYNSSNNSAAGLNVVPARMPLSDLELWYRTQSNKIVDIGEMIAFEIDDGDIELSYWDGYQWRNIN